MSARLESFPARAKSSLRYWLGPRLLLVLPLRTAHATARRLARLLYRRRRNSLQPRIGEISRRMQVAPAEVDRWLARAYELGASDQLDISTHVRLNRSNLSKVIEVQGLDHVRGALQAGNGAILYSGHFFGLISFFVALALHDFTINMTALPETREALWMQGFKRKRFEHLTDELGIKPLRVQDSNFGIAVHGMNALRRNEIVTIIVDQPFKGPTTEVDFLNAREPFPLGPAILAKESGAPLLPFWVNRTNEWLPEVAVIGEPQFVDDDLEAATQRCADWLEGRILSDPPSWSLWLNPSHPLDGTKAEA